MNPAVLCEPGKIKLSAILAQSSQTIFPYKEKTTEQTKIHCNIVTKLKKEKDESGDDNLKKFKDIVIE